MRCHRTTQVRDQPGGCARRSPGTTSWDGGSSPPTSTTSVGEVAVMTDLVALPTDGVSHFMRWRRPRRPGPGGFLRVWARAGDLADLGRRLAPGAAPSACPQATGPAWCDTRALVCGGRRRPGW